MGIIETTKETYMNKETLRERTDLSFSTINRAMESGKLGYYKIGTRVLFSETHLHDFLVLHEQKTNSKSRKQKP